MVCNTNSSIQSKINVIGSISGAQLTFEFTQASHGFQIGDVIRYDDAYAGFTLAQANTSENSEVTGVVREISGDHIFLVTQGVIPIDGFTFARSADRNTSVSGYTASAYFLSGQTAGLLDTAPPTQGGYVVKPTVVNMGAIGGRQYGMIKNYVGNQIGGNASASIGGISPVGSIVPFVGYETKIPVGFVSCNGSFISPSKYTSYNRDIGGKFGYKIRIGITGDTPYKRHQFMTTLNDRLGNTYGSSEAGRPRFRQEFPGTRQGNGSTSGFLLPGENKVFVIQGDVAEVSAPGDLPDENATSGGGPYYIDVEITQDNQVDLPRILWAEKYGNETYATLPGAEFGRQDLGDGSGFIGGGPDGYEIRSSFLANYNMEEATKINTGTDSSGFGTGSRTKIFRQDNTGSHGLNPAGGLERDESIYNSYTQESPGHENAYKRVHGNGAETPTPRNINTSTNGVDGTNIGGEYHNPYLESSTIMGNGTGTESHVHNYDSHSPANEREIVSYISETIGAPLPYFTATPGDDYAANVRTYIITNDVSYDDLNKRVGGVNTNTDSTTLEYEDYFEIAKTDFQNLAWVPSTHTVGSPGGGGPGDGQNTTSDVNALLLNTTNAGLDGLDGTGNKIDFISITGIRVPDLRDRYLKGKAEPADFYGAEGLIDPAILENDAYAVMNSYDGGVGLRGGTNRTHSQKLLSVSHVSSPAASTQDAHLAHWSALGHKSFHIGDGSEDAHCGYYGANSADGIWYDMWAPNDRCPASCSNDTGSQSDGTPQVPAEQILDWRWAPMYFWNEWWNWQRPRGSGEAAGPAVGDEGYPDGKWTRTYGQASLTSKTGYGRIFGDDGLYNMSGFAQSLCRESGSWGCDHHTASFNRDRYHRVDTPGIVTDNVSTPQVLYTGETGTPLNGEGNYDPGMDAWAKDDMRNHQDYQVIDRDANNDSGTLFGVGIPGYHPVMAIDPHLVNQFAGRTWNEDWTTPSGDGLDPGDGFFGRDYETFAYITNEPKYMTVNWLVRVEDDTTVALVDDTTFRKLNCDGINDDGSLLSASSLSPLNLTNLPTSDPGVVGAVWSNSNILTVSAG